ncbi:MAG: hypothetical protein ACRET0_12045, partial [Steroidobacteraceae bacterium]
VLRLELESFARGRHSRYRLLLWHQAAVWGPGPALSSQLSAQQMASGPEPVVHLVPEQQEYFQGGGQIR